MSGRSDRRRIVNSPACKPSSRAVAATVPPVISVETAPRKSVVSAVAKRFLQERGKVPVGRRIDQGHSPSRSRGSSRVTKRRLDPHVVAYLPADAGTSSSSLSEIR